jgi:membrane-bound metal-dependent hydrolase YbcI (DUF457 family)
METLMPSPIGHALAGVAVAWSAEQLPGSAGLKRPFPLAVTLSCVALAVLPDADLIYLPIHRTVTHSIGTTMLVTILAIIVTGKVTRFSTLRRDPERRDPSRGTTRTGHGEAFTGPREAFTDRMETLPGRRETLPGRMETLTGQGKPLAAHGEALQAAHVAWGLVLIWAAAHASHLLLDWLGADPSWPFGIQALWPFSHGWFISGWNLFPVTERRHVFSAVSIAINLKAAAWEIAIIGPIVLALGLWRRRGTGLAPTEPERAT